MAFLSKKKMLSGGLKIILRPFDKAYIKGTQSAMWPHWPGHYFCQFEKRLPQLEIKSTRQIHLEIRFNPAWRFIRSSIFYWKSLLEQTFTHPTTLFNHIWLKTVFKGTWNRRGEKRVGGRAGEIAFVYQNNKRNESVHWRAKNCYTYLENRWKRFHIFGKSSFLDREPPTMIQTSCASCDMQIS